MKIICAYGIFNSDDGVLVCCMVNYGLVTSYLTESGISMYSH